MQQFADYISNLTGQPIPALFMGPSPLCVAFQSGETLSITHWDSSLGTQPTTAQIAAALAAPPPAAVLGAYANSKLVALFAIARPYPLGSGVSVKCDTTTSTGANLAALNAWGAAAPTATTQWVDDFGAVTQITGAEAVVLASAVVAYGQLVYAELASALAGISGGSITTTAQIDALSWPV